MRGLLVPILAALAWGAPSGRCELADLGSDALADIAFGTGAGQDYTSFSTGSYGSGDSSGYSYNPAPTVTKNVYIHLAPEEPQYAQPSRILAPSQPRRRYKIIFIKAPSQPPPAGANIQLPQQDEEKTLIYILYKKQEDQAEIKIQDAVPTKPSKPEVYFIRYRTPKTPGGSYGPPPSGFNRGSDTVSSSYGAPST